MNFSSLKNIPPLYYYAFSVFCFVIANLVRDQSVTFYYLLLLIGLAACFAGFSLRIKSK